MKICRLARSSGSNLHGWLVSAHYLSKAQIKLGHKVDIIGGGQKREEGYFDGVRLIRVNSKTFKIFNLQTIKYGINSLKIIKDGQYDLVHGHDRDPFIYSVYNKFRRVAPFVLHSHSTTKGWEKYGILKLKANGFKGLAENITDFQTRKIYEHFVHKSADLIFAVSEFLKQEIINEYGISEDKIFVSYNGVDMGMFKPNPKSRKILNLPEDKFIILSTSADLRKGRDILVNATKILRRKYSNKFRVYIAGSSGNIKSNVREIVYLPMIDYNLMPLYHSAADLFVLPSRYETFGKNLIESLACERPVVSTRAGAIPEVVDDKSGLLLNNFDSKQLADRIEILMLDDKLRKKMGVAGRKRVTKLFTWDIVAKRVDEGYKLLAD